MRSSQVWWACFVLCQNIVYCEVITRPFNINEGSVCFMGNDTSGLCRRNCFGKPLSEYMDEICNPGQNPPLYCCLDKDAARLYPTIFDICLKRRLLKEFQQRYARVDANDKLEEARAFVREEARKNCYSYSLHFEQEYRSDFIRGCLETGVASPSQYFQSWSYRNPKFVTTVGLYHRSDAALTLECTGIFIHTYFFLTTASCITHALQHGKPPNVIKDKREDGLELKVEKLFVHESYSQGSLHDNIAIVQAEIRKELVYIDQWSPSTVCLWTKARVPQQGLSISVHSYSKNTNRIHPIACESDMNGNISCNICILKEEGLKDELLIGPVQYTENFQPNVPYLVGIASFARSCSGTSPSFITSIFPYLEWIEGIISQTDFLLEIR